MSFPSPYWDRPKLGFAATAKLVASTLSDVAAQTKALADTWDDRFYGPGAANEVTDQDLLDLGIKADDVYAFVIFCTQFQTFMNGGTPTPADYGGTINRLRNL